MSGGLAIAVLAAGSARRFGGGKLDAELAGKPLWTWAFKGALAVPHERMVMVVGDRPPVVAGDCETLFNDRATEGIGTSIALAARWAAGSDALLITLADMPLVSSETLRKLAMNEGPAAVTYPGGRPGAPACFPAALLPALERLSGDAGAAQILRGLPDVTLIEASESELRDVDRPEDLADIARQLASR